MSNYGTTSNPQPAGPCPNCGGQTYVGLSHICSTVARSQAFTPSSAEPAERDGYNTSEYGRLGASYKFRVMQLEEQLKAAREEVAELQGHIHPTTRWASKQMWYYFFGVKETATAEELTTAIDGKRRESRELQRQLQERDARIAELEADNRRMVRREQVMNSVEYHAERRQYVCDQVDAATASLKAQLEEALNMEPEPGC